MIKKYRWWICIFAVTYMLGLAIFLPASLMDILLSRLTEGRLSVGAASGSFWKGQGQMAVQGPGVAVALGKISWEIAPAHLLLARIRAALQQDFEGKQGKALLSVSPAAIELRQMEVQLPAGVLSVASPALAVMAPSGRLTIRTDAFRMAGSHNFSGRAVIDWDAASLLQRDAGSYRLSLVGNGVAVDGEMQTRSGALTLSGKGTWQAGQPFKMEGRAGLAPGADSNKIMPLFRTICPRGGNECRISRG